MAIFFTEFILSSAQYEMKSSDATPFRGSWIRSPLIETWGGCYLLYPVFPVSDAISASCIFLFCPFSCVCTSSFTFYFSSFSLPSYFCFILQCALLLCFFLCASFKKKLSTCASDSYIVHFIPAPCIISLFVHPIFSCIYSLFFLFSVHPFCVYSLLHFL